MCRHAKDVALVSMKLAIVLLLCQAMLLFGPTGFDTYYNLQVIRALPDLIRAVLLLGAVGSFWLQSLFAKAGD